MSLERTLTEFEVHLKKLNLQNATLFREPLTEKLDDVGAEILALKKAQPISRGRAARLQIAANNVKAFRNKVNTDLLLKIPDSLHFEAIKSELLKDLRKLRGELFDLNLVQNLEVTGENSLSRPSWLSNNKQVL